MWTQRGFEHSHTFERTHAYNELNQRRTPPAHHTDPLPCRMHETLRCTPAMAAGVTNRLWSVRELIEAAESEEGIAA